MKLKELLEKEDEYINLTDYSKGGPLGLARSEAVGLYKLIKQIENYSSFKEDGPPHNFLQIAKKRIKNVIKYIDKS